MRFSQLINGIETISFKGDLSIKIEGITHDSREVAPGYVFVAIKGEKFDGHLFIEEAIKRGAAALVVEDESKIHPCPLPYILVPSSRKALAELSARFYNYPSRRLKLIGVTGTNGKGLTCHFIYNIFKTMGKNVAYLGTLGAWLNDEAIPWYNKTTPEATYIQKFFSQLPKDETFVVMEVSSHAISQYRTWGCEFDIAVFTNLSQDHLDYHKDMDSYFQTKLSFFLDYPPHTPKRTLSVINLDDPYGKLILKKIHTPSITYGTSSKATIRGYLLEQGFDFLLFHLLTPIGEIDIRLPFGGIFNFSNALAASAVAYSENVSLEIIKKGLESSPPLPGRFENIKEGQDFAVIVDYAHTPQGIEQLLSSVAPICKGRKIIVFGCGGNRDRNKRPIMGKIASELADVVIITSDNPRGEEPKAIIDEILSGISPEMREKIIVEADREKAIKIGVGMASEGDCLLIAGKGHETYQIFSDRVVPFDDREIARKYIRERINGAHAI
ncbi:UDP-N-acetylmuramoyl-L-alanyl-D-glutamate--2,6-diaminopimelate ligase [bacterium]|nr:UDP-N-acetylmuramoyl-L-alanyl-D-glutamate--2,6-diaminopimelate ligase [bacterium]